MPERNVLLDDKEREIIASTLESQLLASKFSKKNLNQSKPNPQDKEVENIVKKIDPESRYASSLWWILHPERSLLSIYFHLGSNLRKFKFNKECLRIQNRRKSLGWDLVEEDYSKLFRKLQKIYKNLYIE